MPPQRILIEEQRLDKLSADLRNAVDDADDLTLQHVFSSHLVLAGSGHIEKSVRYVLSEYGRINGNNTIKRFVEKTVARNYSLNCERIKKILDIFNPEWWEKVEAATSETERDAVNSLKTRRDKIAHGERDGTGFSTVDSYYRSSKSFIRAFSTVVLEY